MPSSSGPRQVTRLELLDIRERAWRPMLRGVSLVAEAEIPEAHRMQAASALGVLYGKGHYSPGAGLAFLTKWPACLVAAMSGVAVTGYAQGTYWPALWKTAGYTGNATDQQVWGEAFAVSAARLGLPAFAHSSYRYIGPVLMHAGIPAYCLGDFFRLLAERRRQDPALDADGFMAWATASGRQLRLSQLDKPAQRFLTSGGEYAHDVVDRTLDLLERLAEPDPDLDGIGLPTYMIQAARDEVARGGLNLTATRRTAQRAGTRGARQARPRIALDPYGAGVQVLLPAVGDMPDGTAQWRVTADGVTGTVQSRAMWVGAAEAAPETSYPLSRPVRTVLVSLAGREDLAAELRVVEQSDPVLFFAQDGRRLPGTVSLPRAQVWIMHPADRELEFTGQAGPVTESEVPFGWDGWRLVRVSLQDVGAVGLRGGQAHQVEFQARPQLLHGEPVPGVVTPYGSPVYPLPPALLVPSIVDAQISWHVEVRRVGDEASLVSRSVNSVGEIDIWQAVPRPVLGAFEVTVRGPLGRGLRRTIVVAEGLSVSYRPQARLLTGAGLATGKASLTAAEGAAVTPASLHFGPGERSQPIEYRTDTETEPFLVTPPHAALLCPGAGITTWTTALLRLVTEDFGNAGRLLVRHPGAGQSVQLALEVYVRGERVQSIPASGQRSAGLAGFELGRAADTVAAHGQAQLVLNADGVPMPVGYVRPRTLASGAELKDETLVLQDAAAVEGLVAGVYLGYAPWRPPVELSVDSGGTAELPRSLVNAGPLRVLVRVDDPWTVSNWPAWPDSGAYSCSAPGVPSAAEPDEEALSRFVAGVGELPAVTALGRLWRLVELAPDLVRLGARADLAERCTDELLRQPRAALLALVDQDLSNGDVVHGLILTGLAAAPPDPAPWTPAELTALERLWAAFPAAAAIAAGPSLASADFADLAASHCGESLGELLAGRPDPGAGVGRFGPEAERMQRFSSDQVEALWQAAAVVPQALLDTDTRLAAARRLFDARNEMPVRAAATVVKTVTRAAEFLIAESHCPETGRAIAARRPAEGKGGWLALPAMSIAMALTARLAARGDAQCAALEEMYRGKWANLTMHAPDLVSIDLVRAEALLVGALNEKREEAL